VWLISGQPEISGLLSTRPGVMPDMIRISKSLRASPQ
jgi:hypothetical protein